MGRRKIMIIAMAARSVMFLALGIRDLGRGGHIRDHHHGLPDSRPGPSSNGSNALS
jgi:hypothetical protein